MCDHHLHEGPSIGIFTETESRAEASGAYWEKGGGWCFMGKQLQLGMVKKCGRWTVAIFAHDACP